MDNVEEMDRFLPFNCHVGNNHGFRDQPLKGKDFIKVTTKPPQLTQMVMNNICQRNTQDAQRQFEYVSDLSSHSFTHAFNKYPLSTYNMSDSVRGGRNTGKKQTISAFIGFLI